MLRDEQFKLISYPMSERVQLFDLDADPNELNDLSEDPEYAWRVTAMREDLDALKVVLGDTLTHDDPEGSYADFMLEIKPEWQARPDQ